tara:strand:- start:116 stop:598 length:483 start_codon:yes stop_codon:yes gene_type:complete
VKIFFYITFLFIILSCQNGPRTHKYFDEETGQYIIDTLPYNDLRDYPLIEKSQNKDSLIAAMIETDYVHERFIGFAGYYPEQYARFERLLELVSTKELLELTKHENPVIRVYAYKGLQQENSIYLKQAQFNLKEDTTEIKHMGGCIVGRFKIMDYIKMSD